MPGVWTRRRKSPLKEASDKIKKKRQKESKKREKKY